jgi:uncharacterized protein (TIRG00374 family)
MAEVRASDNPAAGRCPRAKWRRPLVRGGISVALLALLFSRLDVGRLADVARQARLDLLAAMLGVMVLCRWYGAYRWYVLLKHHDPRAKFWPLVRVNSASQFLGLFLPGGSMEVLRVVGQSRGGGSDVGSALTSVLADRYFGLLALVLMTLTSMALASGGMDPRLTACALGCLVLLVVVAAVVLHGGLRPSPASPGEGWREVVRRHLVRISQCVDSLRDAPGLVAWALVLAVGFQVLRVGTVMLGAWAWGVEAPLLWFSLYVPVIIFIQLLPVAVGGLGVREFAYVYFFGLLGVDPEKAVVMSLGIYFCTILTSLPGAWFSTVAFQRAARPGYPPPVPAPPHSPLQERVECKV